MPTAAEMLSRVRTSVRSATTELMDRSEQQGRQESMGVGAREYSRGVRAPGPPTKLQDAWDRYVRSVRDGDEDEIKKHGDRYERVLDNKE